MNWRDHSRLTGKHALLGASNYHWLNYDADRLTNAVLNYQAKERGTRLHAFAAECIDLKQKLPKNKKTLNTYVNDAIGFRMDTEQVLYYSDNCYGTADAISFNDGFLRIHDLKTGAVPAHMEQLYIMPLCSVWSTDTTRKIFGWSSVSTRTMKFWSRTPLKRKSAPSSLKSKSSTRSSLIFC